MNSTKITEMVKVWAPFIFGLIMFYVSFVKLEDTVARLDKIVENLTVITTEINTSVQVHEEKLKNHEYRLNKLEK
jgi:hypothetical protein